MVKFKGYYFKNLSRAKKNQAKKHLKQINTVLTQETFDKVCASAMELLLYGKTELLVEYKHIDNLRPFEPL